MFCVPLQVVCDPDPKSLFLSCSNLNINSFCWGIEVAEAEVGFGKLFNSSRGCLVVVISFGNAYGDCCLVEEFVIKFSESFSSGGTLNTFGVFVFLVFGWVLLISFLLRCFSRMPYLF